MSQIPQLDMFCSWSNCAHTFKSGKLGDFKKIVNKHLFGHETHTEFLKSGHLETVVFNDIRKFMETIPDWR